MNLWRDLPTSPEGHYDYDVIHAVIEIPRGSRNKYEYDEATGVFMLDRVLYSSIIYPGDYGFVPQTFYEDGDPLDVLVMTSIPTFPGCVIKARPIGIFKMMDKGDPDDKILAVPFKDPLSKDYHDIDDLPHHYLDEVRHFFSVYKDLEGVRVEPIGWHHRGYALEQITAAAQLFRQKFGVVVP